MHKISNDIKDTLIKKAVEARKNAYVPYSKFKVGCALIVEYGTVYTGCNIENVSFGATICAERTAIVKAVSDGHRKIVALAVSASNEPVSPCEICRQFISEFALNSDMLILCTNKDGSKVSETKISSLLPTAFNEFKNDCEDN